MYASTVGMKLPEQSRRTYRPKYYEYNDNILSDNNVELSPSYHYEVCD